MEVRAIREGEENAAAAVVYEATRGAPADAAALAAFRRQADALGTDLSRQVVAVTDDGTVVASALYFPSPDGTATASPPFCRGAFARTELQVALIRALRAKAADDGVRMLQAITDEHDAALHHVLTESGFDDLALMLFMERPARVDDRNIVLDQHIRWVSYTPARHDAFARAVEASYEGTLDCVKLGDARSATLTLDAYRRRGEVDPALWLLAEMTGETVACLLLVRHPEESSYEVAYVAVLPGHRGKGLGRKVMRKGLFEVASRSLDTRLTLAVDEANGPAVDIYRDLGFTVSDRKRVHFSLLATA